MLLYVLFYLILFILDVKERNNIFIYFHGKMLIEIPVFNHYNELNIKYDIR